jgi:hypothetical protein
MCIDIKLQISLNKSEADLLCTLLKTLCPNYSKVYELVEDIAKANAIVDAAYNLECVLENYKWTE